MLSQFDKHKSGIVLYSASLNRSQELKYGGTLSTVYPPERERERGGGAVMGAL